MSLLLAFVAAPAPPVAWVPAVPYPRAIVVPYVQPRSVLVTTDVVAVAPTWVPQPIARQTVVSQYRSPRAVAPVSDPVLVADSFIPNASMRPVTPPPRSTTFTIVTSLPAAQWVPPTFRSIPQQLSLRGTTVQPTPSPPAIQPDSLAFLVPWTRPPLVSPHRVFSPTRVFGPDGPPPVVVLTGPRFDVFLPDSGSARSFSVAITGTSTRGTAGSQTAQTRSTTGTVSDATTRSTTGTQTGAVRGTSGTSTPSTGRQ